jgi:hypothetical protein
MKAAARRTAGCPAGMPVAWNASSARPVMSSQLGSIIALWSAKGM